MQYLYLIRSEDEILPGWLDSVWNRWKKTVCI